MKIFFLIIGFLFTLNGAQIDDFAKSVNYEREYKTALAKAQKEQKTVMLLVVADYCPWCKKFERKTLEDESVKEFVGKNFIPVVIDKIRERGSYPNEYDAPLIPAVFFINPHTQKNIFEVVAYRTKDEFMLDMQNALKKQSK